MTSSDAKVRIMIRPELFKCPSFVTGNVEMDVLEQAGMTRAQDESITIEPDLMLIPSCGVLENRAPFWVFGIVTHREPPKGDTNGGSTHNGSGMTSFVLQNEKFQYLDVKNALQPHLLGQISSKTSNRVDDQLLWAIVNRPVDGGGHGRMK